MEAKRQIFDFFEPAPETTAQPLLITSPHSGSHYPEDFLIASRLDAHAIRQSEDMFVADLFAGVETLGASLLAARLPRAYLDLNRAPFELEQELFEDDLPSQFNSKSLRARAGLGIVPRLVAENTPIYSGKLAFAEAEHRIEKFYTPFHAALASKLKELRRQFGAAILIDAHSMPSQAARANDGRPKQPHIDIVLGTRHGRSCHAILTELVENFLKARGLSVVRNQPYAGGYITEHYGRPDASTHAIQIEINRAIYMNERSYQRHAGFGQLSETMTKLVAHLAATPDLATQLASDRPQKKSAAE